MIKNYRRLIAVVDCLGLIAACSSQSNGPSSPSATRSSSHVVHTGATPMTDQTAGAAGPCAAATLDIRRGPRLSPASGEHGVILSVISTSSVPCTITGYPTVKLIDAAGSPMHFTYAPGRGQYVTHRQPQPVTIGGGKAAYFLVAKYRCDTGYAEIAAGLNILFPGQGTTHLAPTSWILGDFDLCTGGVSPDPGNTVTISPFEPAVDLLAT